jgi:glycosyltransferase involved in cell wall biosynthesis
VRILFLSQLLPYPADAGAKVRSYYVLRWLARQHAVTLVAFRREDDSEVGVRHLEGICERVITVPMRRSRLRDVSSLAKSVMGGKSFIIERDVVKEMVQAVRDAASEGVFEAVHADQLWMAQYALRAEAESGRRMLTVLDEHNACYQIFERLARGEQNPLKRRVWKREAARLQGYEAEVCRKFARVVTVTDEDREILGRLAGRGDLRAIPICVDTSEVRVVKAQEGAMEVLHLGTMFWPPNVEGVAWFGREVWPRVVARVPEARLTIVGKNPPGEVRALAKGGGNVEVSGYVEDVRPYVEKAGVFIVPLLSGGGMRVKIVDAWRWGLPVVSTRLGAEGIAYEDGENILIADGAEAFAEAVVRILRDDELGKRLRGEGRRWVEGRYEWTKVYRAWDEVYEAR